MVERERTSSLDQDVDRVTEAQGYAGNGEGGPQSRPSGVRSFLGRVWRGWLKVAEVIGTIQMMVILSLMYWTILAITAIPFKLLADPLRLRSAQKGGWVRREPVSPTLENMRRQY